MSKMSKTFKPVIETDRQFKVVQSIDARADFQLAIMDDFNGNKYVSFDNSDAPALALAILEAAGFDDVDSGNTSCAVADLRTFIARQERITAEAKAQAELEAEALELFKTLMGVKGYENFTWSEVASKDEWLAVARRAREMRAEK